MRTRLFRLFPLFAMVVATHGYAFGIDKVFADLDASKGFKSVGTFVLFNDDTNGTIFVTARALSWDMDAQGQVSTVPSKDIEIFPSVQKIGPGEIAPFKVRYSGQSMEKREGDYRVLFTQIRLPSAKATQEGDLSKVAEDMNQSMQVGLAMSVPVYVSDFSASSGSLGQVSATFKQTEHGAMLDVLNKADRHITITGVHVNGEERPGMGPVLAGHERTISIDSKDPVKSVEVEVSLRGKSKTITAVGG